PPISVSLEIPGYITDGVLFEDEQAVLYRATRAEDHLPVLLKTPRSPHPGPDEITRLRREFEIGRDLDTTHVVAPLAFDTSTPRPVLVLEDAGGVPSRKLLGAPMP